MEKKKWALSTYEGNVGLIRNYIEPMVGSVKLSEINTRFMEKYYQGLLQTKAVGNPVKGNKKNEFVSASTVREIHKLLRNCFEQAIKWEMIEKIRAPMQRCRNINHRNGKSGQQKP